MTAAQEALTAVLHGTASFHADADGYYDTLARSPGLVRVNERTWACTAYGSAVDILASPAFALAPPRAAARPDSVLDRVRAEWIELQHGLQHRAARQAGAVAVAGAEAAVAEAVDEVVRDLPRRLDECDLVAAVVQPAVAGLVRRLFGIPESSWRDLVPLMRTVAANVAVTSSPDAEEAARAIYRTLPGLRAEVAGDVPGRALTPAQVINLFVDAGPLTSMAATHLNVVLRSPERREAVVRDRRCGWDDAVETSRLDPAQMLLPRTALVTSEAGAERIAAGERVLVVVGAANRDRGTGPDPAAGTARRSLTFGAGERMCIGRSVALRTTVEITAHLAARYPVIEMRPAVYAAQAAMRLVRSLPARLQA